VNVPIAVLVTSDSKDVVMRLVRELQQGGYDPRCERVDTVEAMKAALDRQPWDVIFANRSIPAMSGSIVARLVEESGLDMPVIVVSGEACEAVAVEMLKACARSTPGEGSANLLNRELERRVAERAGQRDNISRSLEDEITRRSQAEQALKGKTEELDRYFDRSPDLLAIADTDGYLRRVNPEWEKVLGHAPHELEGRRFLDFVHPEDLPATLDVLARLSHQEEIVDFVNRYRCKDGSLRWIEWRAYPTGRIIYGIGRDVTGRREAEKAVRRQAAFDEMLTRILTRFAACGTSEVDAGLLAALQAIAEFVGVDHAYVIEIAPDRTTYHMTHEWCGPNIMPQFQNYQDIPFGTLAWSENRILAGEAIRINRLEDFPAEAEAERQMPDVKAGQSSMLSVPIHGTEGVLHGLVGLDSHARPVVWSDGDVARLKMVGDAIANAIDRKKGEEAPRQANAHNRRLLEASLDPLVTIGRDGKITDVNTATEQVTGRSRQELVGTDFSDYFTAPERAREAYQLAFRAGLVRDYALEFRDRDGNVISVLYNASVYRDEEGKVIGVFAAARDVTERLQAELEAHNLREDLARVARIATLGQLTGSIAHEIRQPLSAIMSNAQAALHLIAREKPDLDEAAEALRDIIHDDRRAGEIIHRLREMMQKGEPRREPLDLNDLIRQVLAMVHSEAIIRHFSIRLQLPPDLPPVEGDRIQLQQVILNLLLNGAEARSQAADGPLELTVKTALRHPASVVVSVSDTGIGIKPEDMESIFAPFYTTKPHGLGMGLPVSRSIVRTHGGQLWAEPNPDRGTTFHMALPALAGKV